MKTYLGLILLMGSVCSAQTVERTSEPRKPTQLLSQYSGFTEDDVLARIFDDYDPATKSVSKIPNSENKQTKVSILEAKPWRIGSNVYLVVLTNLGDRKCCAGTAQCIPL